MQYRDNYQVTTHARLPEYMVLVAEWLMKFGVLRNAVSVVTTATTLTCHTNAVGDKG